MSLSDSSDSLRGFWELRRGRGSLRGNGGREGRGVDVAGRVIATGGIIECIVPMEAKAGRQDELSKWESWFRNFESLLALLHFTFDFA